MLRLLGVMVFGGIVTMGPSAWAESPCQGIAAKTAIDRTIDDLLSRPTQRANGAHLILLEEVLEETGPSPLEGESLLRFDAGLLVRSPHESQSLEIHSQWIEIRQNGDECELLPLRQESIGIPLIVSEKLMQSCEDLALSRATKLLTESLLQDGDNLLSVTLLVPGRSQVSFIEVDDDKLGFTSPPFTVLQPNGKGQSVQRQFEIQFLLQREDQRCEAIADSGNPSQVRELNQ